MCTTASRHDVDNFANSVVDSCTACLTELHLCLEIVELEEAVLQSALKKHTS